MRHVVIGGGVAGVVCTEELCRLCPDDEVLLLSASTVLKGVDSVIRITKTIEEVTITEKDLTALQFPNLRVLQAVVTSIDTHQQLVHLASGEPVAYGTLCIACGARPKVLGFQHERIITLRDTESVVDFASRLCGARRIAVVGNGGIALELIGAVRDVGVVWVLKHGHIGDAFFDVDAAEFLLQVLQQRQCQAQPEQHQHQHQHQHQQHQHQPQQHQSRGSPSQPAAVHGHAAGPKWVHALPAGVLPANVQLERNALVVGASSTSQKQQQHQQQQEGQAAAAAAADAGIEWPLYLQLSNGEELGVDLVVQAIGVEPATAWLPAELARAPDGGILVNSRMQTSLPGVFAAGDCCTVESSAQRPHWFQMRLWTQARLMGAAAAAGMARLRDEDNAASFAFELFTHVTRFLGLKVVLLGLYNGQKLQQEPAHDMALYSRVTTVDGDASGAAAGGASFVRVLLLRGRLQGAVLVGETDLEETFENLILDGLDLSAYGPALLDPDVELDHVFD